MPAWSSSCRHDRHHAGMIVIMLAWSSSCQPDRHHAGMIVIMPAWLSSCPHGCHHAGMVFIMPAWLSSCRNGCHYAGIVVIMLAWLLSCQNGLHCKQCCHFFGKFVTVLKAVVYMSLLSSCTFWKSENIYILCFFIGMVVIIKNGLHWQQGCLSTCCVSFIIEIIVKLTIFYWMVFIMPDGYHHASIVVIMPACLLSCRHGFHHAVMVVIMTE